MKKLLMIALMFISINSANAQNKKYIATMEKNIAALDTSRTADLLQPLANNFERIASAEKRNGFRIIMLHIVMQT